MRFKLCIAALMLITAQNTTTAQTTFKKTFPEDNIYPGDHITMVSTVDDGTIIARKVTDNSADFTITKLDNTGIEKWSKKYNLPNVAYIVNMTPDSKDNGFAILCRSTINTNIAVIKCDSLGNVEWRRQLGVEGRALSWSFSNKTALITNTKDGGYYIGAVTDQYGNYDEKLRLILIRLDKNGNKLWHTSHEMKQPYGYTEGFMLDAISETYDNGVIIAERYPACDYYCYNTYIYGFDKDGNSNLGRVIYGSSSGGYISTNISKISSGKNSIEVIGNIRDWKEPYYYKTFFKLKTEEPSVMYILQENIFALKDFLQKRSSTAFTGKSLEESNTATLLKQNGTLLTATETYNQYDLQNRICTDYTVPAFDTTFTKDKDLMITAPLLLKKNDSIIISGLAVTVTSIAPLSQSICSGNATGIAASSIATSVQQTKISKQNIYPNPAKDILNIQANGTNVFTLINQSGKTILSKNITNKGEINIVNLPAGLYFLKNNTTGFVEKVFISK